MRDFVFAIAAFGLAGCEHMYGAGDLHLSDDRLIEMARQEAARREVPLTDLEPSVRRFETGASIAFSCRGGCLHDPVAMFFVPSGKRRITYVRFGGE
ncbi:MAG: hypothetical protein ACOY5Y_09295 [Pseudomonadota bacterium]